MWEVAKFWGHLGLILEMEAWLTPRSTLLPKCYRTNFVAPDQTRERCDVSILTEMLEDLILATEHE